MATILVILIIILCAVFQYFKGNITRAISTIIVALSASFVSFGYYEMLGGLLDRVESLVPWAQVISFMLLFILSFAIMQTLVMFGLKEPIDFGLWPERIGRPLLGIFLGWIISGVLITAVSLAPLSTKLPYARFEDKHPKVDQPKKVFLNADGLVAGWFSTISQGAFSSLKSNAESFAMVRAGFLDQLFLNRIAMGQSNPPSLRTSKKALTLDRKAACWFAEDLVDIDGETINAQSGHRLMVVNMGIRLSSDESPFTLSQVRAICKAQDGNPTRGKGVCVYPIGTMASETVVDERPLHEKLTIDKDHGNPRVIAFVFNVPNGTFPTLAQFKLNNSEVIPAPISIDDDTRPDIVPFGLAERPQEADESSGSEDN